MWILVLCSLHSKVKDKQNCDEKDIKYICLELQMSLPHDNHEPQIQNGKKDEK